MKSRSSSSSSSNVARSIGSQQPAIMPASTFYYDATVVPAVTGRATTGSRTGAKSVLGRPEELAVMPSSFYHDDDDTTPLNRPVHRKIGRVHVGLPAPSFQAGKPKQQRSHQQRHVKQKKQLQRLLIVLAGALLAVGLIVSGLFQLGQWAMFQSSSQEAGGTERSLPASSVAMPFPSTATGLFKGEPFNVPAFQANQTTLFGVESWLNASLYWPYQGMAFAPLSPLALPAETVNATLQAYLNSSALQLGEGFRPHVLFYDPFSNTHAELNAQEPVPSASVIKLPLLYLYGLRLASGVNQPSESLLLEERHRVEGSGIWVGRPAHSRFTLGETAANMIQSSDNVATEMMLEALGGVEKVNQQFSALGYASTRVRNQLPDKEGLNTVSMVEMVQSLINIQHHGVFQSTQVSGQLLDILEKTHNRRLIPGLLPKGTPVFHKTGDIGKSLGESAMVQLPDGRYYYLAMMIERPHNNGQAADFIRLFSQRVYEYQVAHAVTPKQALFAAASVPSSSAIVSSTPALVGGEASSTVTSVQPVPPEVVEVF